MIFNFSGPALAIENEIQKELATYLRALKGNASFDKLRAIREKIAMLEEELRDERKGPLTHFL